MQSTKHAWLWQSIADAGRLSDRALWGADGGVVLGDLVSGASLSGGREALRGRSVLIATSDQVTAALALIELDGVARRLVLCPADLPAEHVDFVMASAAVDAIVSDRVSAESRASTGGAVVPCSWELVPNQDERRGGTRTEWILLTSGTSGRPKMVVHTLSSLAGAMLAGGALAGAAVWSTFYDIRRYGGLQILLRALLGGGSMVLSSSRESTGEFLTRAGRHGVTHISGTPSHWRRAIMSPCVHQMAPRYIRLSGEIADQAILDHLRACYPDSRIAHAFASTEAGVAFDVGDGLAGFPANLVGERAGDVEMKVEDGSLRIRSTRTAVCYLSDHGEILAGLDGFVDTGDMVELRGDRYYFVGRKGGIINVGGLKVHPEEVEAVINAHPRVQMSLVKMRKNAITGALVVADVVMKAEVDSASERAAELEREIMQMCREALPRHKVPAAINFVSTLAVAETGKLVRRDA
jgi:acyl-coenzyme A synthetase/AMP-(fatty) acid ligase